MRVFTIHARKCKIGKVDHDVNASRQDLIRYGPWPSQIPSNVLKLISDMGHIDIRQDTGMITQMQLLLTHHYEGEILSVYVR